MHRPVTVIRHKGKRPGIPGRFIVQEEVYLMVMVAVVVRWKVPACATIAT